MSGRVLPVSKGNPMPAAAGAADAGGEEFETAQTPFERVYRGLLRGLYEGRFVPGQRLVAPDLMRQFNAGRGTIREVLQRLASTGVVSIIPHRGAQVRMLSRRDVKEILDIVETLLGLAARGAALAIREPGHADELLGRYEALRSHETIDDFSSFLEARDAYYSAVVSLSGNRELRRLFPSIQVHIMRVQLRNFGRAADSIQLSDYSGLTKAILSADPARAEASARHHVQLTAQRVALLPDGAFEAGR